MKATNNSFELRNLDPVIEGTDAIVGCQIVNDGGQPVETFLVRTTNTEELVARCVRSAQKQANRWLEANYPEDAE